MGTLTDLILPAGTTESDLSTGSILFVGNATVLIRYAGFTILTDPTFIPRDEQVSIGYGMHSKRLTNPALEIQELPPLDLVLLSHCHEDHFDQVAERTLDKTLPIITTSEAGKKLAERGFLKIHPLAAWETLHISKGKYTLQVTATPARHGPSIADFALPEVMGEMVEFLDEGKSVLFRLYITGDTLVFDGIKEISRRYPEIDLALLHLGGTRLMGVLLTMDAKQGVEMLNIIHPEKAIPIHYDDYDMCQSPLSDFQQEIRRAGLVSRTHYLGRGDSHSFRVPESRRSPATRTPVPSGIDSSGE
jgi:L-ascorbate metabolism protein UlaG (beta-lactamase superfamily)